MWHLSWLVCALQFTSLDQRALGFDFLTCQSVYELIPSLDRLWNCLLLSSFLHSLLEEDVSCLVNTSHRVSSGSDTSYFSFRFLLLLGYCSWGTLTQALQWRSGSFEHFFAPFLALILDLLLALLFALFFAFRAYVQLEFWQIILSRRALIWTFEYEITKALLSPWSIPALSFFFNRSKRLFEEIRPFSHWCFT